MKNKNFQILEIGTFRPLSIKFIFGKHKRYGKSVDMHCTTENSTQSIQQ